MSKILKKKFTVGDTEYAVVYPSVKQREAADIHKSVMFGKIARAGGIFRANLYKILREQGAWSDEKEKERKELIESIERNLGLVEAGELSKLELREAAIKVRAGRLLHAMLMAEYNTLDENTVEGIAEQARFQYMVSCCTVYNADGKKVFASFEEFKDKEDGEIADKAAREFSKIYYNIDENSEKGFPENKYLIENGFMDENMELLDLEDIVEATEAKADAVVSDEAVTNSETTEPDESTGS